MKKFKDYLLNLGLRNSSIQQHVKNLNIFLYWLKENELEPKDCTYDNMVKFVDRAMLYYHSYQNPRQAINKLMVAVSYYYDMMILSDVNLNNPAKAIRIKTKKTSLLNDLLEENEYTSIFDSFESKSPRDIRNKVMLGFIIFQGLKTQDLHRLQIDDLRLRSGKIFVRGDFEKGYKRGLNSRVLKLESVQMIDLIDYVSNLRPRILAGFYRHLPGRKPSSENINFKTKQLLLSINGSENLKPSIHHLLIKVKSINPRIKNAFHIRQSVIASWVKTNDIRRVQYMAGHRYVGSTAYYKQVDIQDYKREVIQYHPLS